MSLAEYIANKVKPKTDAVSDPKEVADNEEGMKPGDHGKRIYAAFNAFRATGSDADAESIERAIRDCVEEIEKGGGDGDYSTDE